MRKYYPYLEDPQVQNANQVDETRGFLAQIDDFVNKKQYVRMTLLDWNETPLKEIQGEITTGTINKDGSSSVRRTCSLSTVVSGGEYDIEDADEDFALNKKIFIEIGVKNYTDQYPDYPILWFPQGVFFISSFSVSSSSSSTVNIQLQLKDKMCGLNGYVGGKFPAAVILDTMDTQNASGEYVTQKVKICDIIQELVHHYGGEPLENIVIEDVPERIKRVVKWMGNNPLWLEARKSENDDIYYQAYLQKPDQTSGSLSLSTGETLNVWTQCNQNEDCGYVYDDLVYTGDLTCNLGETVTNALDKIKSYLGNYEYYYDVFGVFHFREIKNYLNTTYATDLLADMTAKNYMVDITTGKAVYTFSDKSNIISISNSPQYENIKNDYIIQGTREGTNTNQKITVRYHLAIDNKPTPGTSYHDLLIYREADTNLKKLAFPKSVDTFDSLPTIGNFNLIYHVIDENAFYYWDDEVYKNVDVVKYYPPENVTQKYGANDDLTNYDPSGYVTKDWRTELYIQGLLGSNNGTDQGMYFSNLTPQAVSKQMSDPTKTPTWLAELYDRIQNQRIDTDYYFEELEAFWPQMYDLENQIFYGEVTDDLVTNANQSVDKATKAEEEAHKMYDTYKEHVDITSENLVKAQTDFIISQQSLKKAKKSRDDAMKTLDDLRSFYNSTGQMYSDEAKQKLTDATNALDQMTQAYDELESTTNQLKEIADEKQNIAQSAKEGRNIALTRWKQAQNDKSAAKANYNVLIEKQISPSQALTDGNYYLDFIDPQTSGLGEFSVQNIGRRVDAVSSDDVNCLFTPEIPDIVWLNVDDADDESLGDASHNKLSDWRAECDAIGQPWSQVHNDIYQYFYTGGYKNGAYDQVKAELWSHTTYQNSLSITALPVFYLEPNSRVRINDASTNTYGDYMVNTISIPLGAGQTMSVSCNRCVQKM